MKSSSSIHGQLKDLRTKSTIKRQLSALVAVASTLALATFAQADIEVIKIGEPSFRLSEIAFGVATLDRAANNAEDFFEWSRNWTSEAFGSQHNYAADKDRFLLLPGTPHVGPYDQEVRRAFAEHGLLQTDVMTASEVRGRNYIQRGLALLPIEGAALGNSPDGNNVPVIPSDIYPLSQKLSYLRNGDKWQPDSTGGEPPLDLSQEGVIIDEHGVEHDFTGLSWSHQVRAGGGGHSPDTLTSELTGVWEQRQTILENNGENGWEIIFRWEVVNRRSRVPGDLNHNGELDMHDLDIMNRNISVAATNSKLDLNDDDSVDYGDIRHWVTKLKGSWIGDANLDGEFNSGDLVRVFEAGKFEVDEMALWSEGDWNADERFDSGDFVAAFQGGGYESGPRVESAASVPEPSSWPLFLIGLLALIRLRK